MRDPGLGLVHDLDCMDADLGKIAAAVSDAEGHLANWGLAEGMNSKILIARYVVVDDFWRGGSLGPALVHLAANVLADAAFLINAPLKTRLNDSGKCVVTGPSRCTKAAKKVRTAWTTAGFERLKGSVLWASPEKLDPEWARTVIAATEEAATKPAAVEWHANRVVGRHDTVGLST